MLQFRYWLLALVFTALPAIASAQATIAGTVRDDLGRPATLVTLRLHRVVTSRTGQRTLTAGLTGANSGATTDDRGDYRFFGLPPGNYVVQALPAMPSEAVIDNAWFWFGDVAGVVVFGLALYAK